MVEGDFEYSSDVSSTTHTVLHMIKQLYAHSNTQKSCCCHLWRAVLNLDDQLSSVCKGLTRVCSKSQATLPNFRVKMISAKQNHTPKLGGFLRGRTQLYLPVNNFPTSHSRIGAFDFRFYECMFYKCYTGQEKLYLAVTLKKAFLTFSEY